QDPGADDRLGQRQRDRVTPSGAHHYIGVGPRPAGAALRFRNDRQGQAVLLDRPPQGLRPLALLRGLDEVLGHAVREQTRDDVAEDRPQLVHRRPSPRAMMPRRISRVPPRSENDGARCTRKPSTCWRSLPESIVGSTPSRVWTISGISCSKVVPTSLTTAASRFGFSPAWSMRATESDIWRSVARCATRRPTVAAARSPGSLD